jgi:predicted nucleic acid-binding protein
MKRVIVADAGPLIALAKIEQIQLLQSLFKHVHVPAIVLQEATGDPRKAGADSVLNFVTRFATVHDMQCSDVIDRLSVEIDAGEAQAIALACELKCGVLMDDAIGRSVAKRLELPVIGVLGVLLQAKREDKISSVRECVEKLVEVRYRLSESLVEQVLRLANE